MKCLKICISLLMLMVLLQVVGCAHGLTVKNIGDYQPTSISSLEKPLTVGIIPVSTDLNNQKLVASVATSLSNYQANVIMPYSRNSNKPVDVIATINVDSSFEGSGWNFLINFPGFLIWTPAWNGYVYTANHNVNIQLAKGVDNQEFKTFALPIKLNLRHAAIDRTWTEVSWFEVGAIALVGGVVFIQYDDDVTPLIGEKVNPQLGNYIAQEIVKNINSYGVKPTANASEAAVTDKQVTNVNMKQPTDRLTDLKKLHDTGVISDEEYNSKKKQLLEQI